MSRHYDLFIDGEWAKAGPGILPGGQPVQAGTWASIPQASETQVADAIAAARRAFERAGARPPASSAPSSCTGWPTCWTPTPPAWASWRAPTTARSSARPSSQMVFAARQYRFFAGYADKLWGKVIPLDQPDVFDFALREPHRRSGADHRLELADGPACQQARPRAGRRQLRGHQALRARLGDHAGIRQAGGAGGLSAGRRQRRHRRRARSARRCCRRRRIDQVSFTGSPGVGREIAADAGRLLTPVTLELGGKSPNIIFEDADFDQARSSARSRASSPPPARPASRAPACWCSGRVRRSRRSRWPSGPSGSGSATRRDPATEMGTAANEPQFNRILTVHRDRRDEGARLVAGGEPARGDGLGKGLFIEPTIFATSTTP